MSLLPQHSCGQNMSGVLGRYSVTNSIFKERTNCKTGPWSQRPSGGPCSCCPNNCRADKYPWRHWLLNILVGVSIEYLHWHMSYPMCIPLVGSNVIFFLPINPAKQLNETGLNAIQTVDRMSTKLGSLQSRELQSGWLQMRELPRSVQVMPTCFPLNRHDYWCAGSGSCRLLQSSLQWRWSKRLHQFASGFPFRPVTFYCGWNQSPQPYKPVIKRCHDKDAPACGSFDLSTQSHLWIPQERAVIDLNTTLLWEFVRQLCCSVL